MRGAALIAISFLGCADGSTVDTPVGTSDAAIEATVDGGSGCLFACDVPAPACVDDCTESTFANDGCDAGKCIITKTTRPCDFGCDKTTGRCLDEPTACLKKLCGKTACGGTCTKADGCCDEMLYDKTTGLAASGASACCDAGDELVEAKDCGTGMNHGINKDGVCATCWEGAMNGGSPCASVSCRKFICP